MSETIKITCPINPEDLVSLQVNSFGPTSGADIFSCPKAEQLTFDEEGRFQSAFCQALAGIVCPALTGPDGINFSILHLSRQRREILLRTSLALHKIYWDTNIKPVNLVITNPEEEDVQLIATNIQRWLQQRNIPLAQEPHITLRGLAAIAKDLQPHPIELFRLWIQNIYTHHQSDTPSAVIIPITPDIAKNLNDTQLIELLNLPQFTSTDLASELRPSSAGCVPVLVYGYSTFVRALKGSEDQQDQIWHKDQLNIFHI